MTATATMLTLIPSNEAHRIFVENLTGTLQVIAKDAKVQVDFNPAVVRSYRLLGYENRAVADSDFRNDQVDAGEVGGRGDFQEDTSETSDAFRFIASVAEYAEILRGSYWAQDSSFIEVQALTLSATQTLGNDNDVLEFMSLLNQAIELTGESGS